MQSAMVITGHERCFHEPGRELVDYLERECRMRYVAYVPAGHRDPDSLQDVVSFHAIRAARQPFLLAYLGHGWDDGWYYGKEHKKKWLVLKYDWIEDMLKQREGPTLILNDTCRSGSLAERLSKSSEIVDVRVIAAATPKGSAVGELTPDVIKSWRQRDTYVPRRRVINDRAWWERCSGVAHDRFFFARPA